MRKRQANTGRGGNLSVFGCHWFEFQVNDTILGLYHSVKKTILHHHAFDFGRIDLKWLLTVEWASVGASVNLNVAIFHLFSCPVDVQKLVPNARRWRQWSATSSAECLRKEIRRQIRTSNHQGRRRTQSASGSAASLCQGRNRCRPLLIAISSERRVKEYAQWHHFRDEVSWLRTFRWSDAPDLHTGKKRSHWSFLHKSLNTTAWRRCGTKVPDNQTRRTNTLRATSREGAHSNPFETCR